MNDLLKKYANLELWRINESTVLKYQYPILCNQKNIKAGLLISKIKPEEQIRKIGPFLTAISKQSHIGPFLHAIDFLVYDDTNVLAAKAGTIIEIVEHNKEWGKSPDFAKKMNYITIRHDKAKEYTQYCHLAYYSVNKCGLFVGSKVKEGQLIAKVGKTGWTDRDHLHFLVFRLDNSKENPFGFRSIQVNFKEDLKLI